tara:strand:- start:98 stop:919 length:822 start_codon:yes stop_codon:yes gene_type:complete
MDIEKINKFINENHQQIEGWFFPLDHIAFFELCNLQLHWGIKGDVCEVGVYRGKSFVLLSLLRAQTERLIGFDLFQDDHQQSAEYNIDKYGDSSLVSFVACATSEIARDELNSIMPSPVRFLHIDAGHEYHEVFEQLELFSPYLGDHALVAMDDYQDREFPGIEAAVLDFAERDRPRRFVPFLAGANKIYLCNAAHASNVQRYLIERPTLRDQCRLTRVRDFNVLIMRSKLPVPSADIVGQLNGLDFPRRRDDELSLNEKAARFAQLTFGSGK